MISTYHHYLYPLYNAHSFTGLLNTSQVSFQTYTKENLEPQSWWVFRCFSIFQRDIFRFQPLVWGTVMSSSKVQSFLQLCQFIPCTGRLLGRQMDDLDDPHILRKPWKWRSRKIPGFRLDHFKEKNGGNLPFLGGFTF